MSKRRLGFTKLEVNKKFNSKKQAIDYAKRLQTYITTTCDKKNWVAQAIIGISHINSDYVLDVHYERTGKRGKPRKMMSLLNENDIITVNKKRLTNKEFYGSKYTDWHIHVLLVSKPCETFRKNIRTYIKNNWNEVEDLYNSKIDLEKILRLQDKGITYSKESNIGYLDYIVKQSEIVYFLNKGKDIIPKEYSLKQLYLEAMKVSTEKHYLTDKWNIKKERKKLTKNLTHQELYYNWLSEKHNKKLQNKYLEELNIVNKVQQSINHRTLARGFTINEYDAF